MTPTECLTVLELQESASLEDIKHAYRRLAQLHHPDKHGGNPAARDRFIELSTAYRTLIQAARAVERGKVLGVCQICRAFGEVIKTLDGYQRCPACALRSARTRLLPMPRLIIATCASTILCIAAAAVLLVVAIARRDTFYAAGACVVGLLSLAALAATCLTVVHCVTPTERALAEQSSSADRNGGEPPGER